MKQSSLRTWEKEPAEINFDDSYINLISVAKVTKTKGFDRLIEVHKKLTEEGYRIKTHILGIGEDMVF